MNTLHTVFRCPYCVPANCRIALDVCALVAMSSRVEVGTHLDVNRRSLADQCVVVFRNRRVPAPPCPHLVTFCVDVDLKRHAGGPRSLISIGATYDHPWYETNDAGRELSNYLWTEFQPDYPNEEPADLPRLVTPYCIRRADQPPISVPPQRYVLVSGRAMWALEPEVFLEALRDGYNRLCEHQDRLTVTGNAQPGAK